jgi:hypothetical protein
MIKHRSVSVVISFRITVQEHWDTIQRTYESPNLCWICMREYDGGERTHYPHELSEAVRRSGLLPRANIVHS